MIRSYKKEDIPRIVQLEQENLLSTLEEQFYVEHLKHPLFQTYIYEREGVFLGFISTIFDGECLEILNFVIDKPYQSKGYGAKLLQEVFAELLPQGLKRSILEVRKSNACAIHLYDKLDFKVIQIRKAYYSNGEDALVLLKEFY